MFSYRLFIWFYPIAIRMASLFNPKARLWIIGRRRLLQRIKTAFSANTRPVIWMHTASLGEFEQGLPVLEQLKLDYPSHRILVTFFSPSGYEIRKDHPVADDVYYLPMDGPRNARLFLDAVQPSLVLFIKYEFWHFYLKETNRRQIPLLLVSGIFRPNQVFFRWYGGFYRRMLSFFSALLVQDADSEALLASVNLGGNTARTGDTRFDRVIAIAETFRHIPGIQAFCGGYPVIVAGSTWTDDDEELDHFANTHPDIRFLIAPHDIGSDRLAECEKLYKNSVRYSSFSDDPSAPAKTGANVMIMDNMGMLSRLYYYADIAYIGGGFGEDGIHNLLEAAVFSKPVVFGPVYDKYIEAAEIIEAGGAFAVADALELEATLTRLLENTQQKAAAGRSAGKYVQMNAGATRKVMDYIQANRLLIN